MHFINELLYVHFLTYTAWEGPNNIPLIGQTILNLNPSIKNKLYNTNKPLGSK